MSSKLIEEDFRDYQNVADLFKNLMDHNVNPKEVLKNQMNLKPDIKEEINQKTQKLQ